MHVQNAPKFMCFHYRASYLRSDRASADRARAKIEIAAAVGDARPRMRKMSLTKRACSSTAQSAIIVSSDDFPNATLLYFLLIAR